MNSRHLITFYTPSKTLWEVIPHIIYNAVVQSLQYQDLIKFLFKLKSHSIITSRAQATQNDLVLTPINGCRIWTYYTTGLECKNELFSTSGRQDFANNATGGIIYYMVYVCPCSDFTKSFTQWISKITLMVTHSNCSSPDRNIMQRRSQHRFTWQ